MEFNFRSYQQSVTQERLTWFCCINLVLNSSSPILTFVSCSSVESFRFWLCISSVCLRCLSNSEINVSFVQSRTLFCCVNKDSTLHFSRVRESFSFSMRAFLSVTVFLRDSFSFLLSEEARPKAS